MSWRDRYESPFSLESPFLEEASTVLDSGPVEERDTPPQGGPITGVAFPSGEKLPVTTGATLAGEEFFDPFQSGNPLLDVSGKNRSKKLSDHFTAGEFAASGGVAFTKARIDPALVQCMESVRAFVKSPLTILNGFYSWKYLVGVTKTLSPTATPHLSGRAAKFGSQQLTSLELAKAAIIVCPDTTSVGVGPASVTIAVGQPAAAITSYITDGEKRERAIAIIRTYRALFSGIPIDAKSSAGQEELDGLKPLVHWAIHEMNVRDAEVLTDLAFYRSGYIAKNRREHGLTGRFDPRKSMDATLRKEVADQIVKPALTGVKAPPAQRGGDPSTPKGEMRAAAAQPDSPGFDLTGRYETIHTDQQLELGKTLCINQAGRRLEIFMSNVLAPDAPPGQIRTLYRLFGDWDGRAFQVFSKRIATQKFSIKPTASGLRFEFTEGDKPYFENFNLVSETPIMLEHAALVISPDIEDLLEAWEWMPLLKGQVKLLKDAFASELFIGGYLDKFFTAEGDWDHWKENYQVKAVQQFGDGIAARLKTDRVGVHKSDWTLAVFYIRQYMTSLQWRPDKTYPYLSALDWAQRLVAVVEYQCKNQPGRTGYSDPSPLIGPLVTLMGLKRDTATDGTLHKYKVTMKLTGGAFAVGGFKAALTIEKVDDRKWPGGAESMTAVIGIFGLSLKWKSGTLPKIGYIAKWKEAHVGYAQSAFYWLPNDFPGQVDLALGELSATVGVKAGAEGGFLHIHGRGGLPVLQVIFSDSDIDPGLGRNIKLGATIIEGFGKILDKKFREIDYPKTPDKTDYTLTYGLPAAVHFGFDSALLKAEGRQSIRVLCANELVALLSPTSSLEIKGHTDSMGAADYNQRLSDFRAKNTLQAIRDVLGTKLRCSATAKGYGEEEAAKAGEKEFRNMDRRRVDVILNGVVVLRLRAE
jgi:outer membrane protein OmpA-like peptidoglycan-associated protein